MLLTKTGFTVNTKNRLVLDAGAVYRDFVSFAAPGTLLGATRDGAVWNPGLVIRSPEIDGLVGDYKELARIVGARPTLQVNLLECTVANLLLALPGADATASSGARTYVPLSFLELGAPPLVIFNTHADLVPGMLSVWVAPAGLGPAVLKTEFIDYTVVNATGVVTFLVPPALDSVVLAEYTFDAGGPATYDMISFGDIAAGDYIGNVALVATVSGHTDPIVLGINNAIADAGYSLKTANQNEAVTQVTFKAHFDPAAPTVIPAWAIYPRT